MMPGLSANTSTAATGTAGGANVFNSAPLFGSMIGTTAGSSNGSGPGGAIAGAASNPLIWLALAAAGIVGLVVYLKFRK